MLHWENKLKKRYKINLLPIVVIERRFFIKFICPICNNKSYKFIGDKKGELYCRKCNLYRGQIANKQYNVSKGNYSLKYDLTEEQKKASEFILNNVKKGQDCALNAVCGAGKTEIIYSAIEYCLSNKMKIGIAIPRKDVVVELKQRISNDFNVNVVGVYGGNHHVLEGDIIVFTTHQAFRYIEYFDVLIIDEIDAFPYKDNEVLKNIISKCSKNFVYLSATMPEYIIKDKNISHYSINRRYHGYDIPLPKCFVSFNKVRKLKRILNRFKNKVVLVYFPTIKIQYKISRKIKYDCLINSKVSNRDELLGNIKNMKKGIVLTTTVLERGITIKNVQVVVFNADHKLFDKDTLIQIAGRVGRSKEFYKGKVIFICSTKTKAMKECIRRIRKCNA